MYTSYAMQRTTRVILILLTAATLALGGCDLFGSDGGGGGTDGNDSGDGQASVVLSVDAAYA
jgi:hypothetical protein